MDRERRFPELCGGAGCIPCTGEPGPGRSDGWVFVVANAFDRSGVRDRLPSRPAGTDSDICKFRNASGAMRRVDDHAHSRFTTYCQPKDGVVTDADGVDTGDCGGESTASRIQPAAQDFGEA